MHPWRASSTSSPQPLHMILAHKGTQYDLGINKKLSLVQKKSHIGGKGYGKCSIWWWTSKQEGKDIEGSWRWETNSVKKGSNLSKWRGRWASGSENLGMELFSLELWFDCVEVLEACVKQFLGGSHVFENLMWSWKRENGGKDQFSYQRSLSSKS